MQNDHFYIGDIRVERSSRVCAGRIQIKTLAGNRILQVVELPVLLGNDDQAVAELIESQPAQGDAVVAFVLERDGRQ